MTGAVSSRPSARPPAPVARFRAALAASAVAHWILLSAPPTDLQWRGIAPIPGSAPITVRLAPQPDLVPDVPVTPDLGVRRRPLPAKSFSGGVGSSLGGDPATGADPPVLAPVPDPHYYSARDLDDFPRPLTALRIDRPPRDGAAEVRLEILIDERGIVQDMTFAGPAALARVEEELRAALAATRFLPAQKDGRAVRSRIVLRVSFDSVDGER